MMRAQVQRHINMADASVVQKGGHYLRLLDAQMVACDDTEEAINRLSRPFASS
mgnify:FL=1